MGLFISSESNFYTKVRGVLCFILSYDPGTEKKLLKLLQQKM